MTLEERAKAIAACRNGVVPGSHLHRRIVEFSIQMMKEAIRDARLGTQDQIARAICRETCAYCGEPPCFEIRDDQGVKMPWPNPNCDDPGCQALALAVIWSDAS